MFAQERFSEAQAMWTDFWTGRNTRPVYSITVPRNGREAAPLPPYLAGFNGDYQGVADMLARWVESVACYSGALACYNLSFGADDFASLLGADLTLGTGHAAGTTSWPSHPLSTLRGANIRFQREGKWWGKLMDFHRCLKRTLGDSVLLSMPTLSGGLDALVGLYNARDLMLDMVDEPELVHEALRQVNAAYTQILEACTEVFEIDRFGSANRHGMYTTGRINVPQCDFSCMVSSAMFEEFAVPGIEHELMALDAGEYHLDGPGAIRHLERLARMPRLKVIQWVSGAGGGEAQDWTWLHRRVLSLGKGLILGGGAQRVAELQRAYRSPNMFLVVNGIHSRMEAEDFLHRMDRLWDDIEVG